jgi:hypothetical protein
VLLLSGPAGFEGEAAWCTRYLTHDGLAGEEGTFLLCTFWLAQAQALAGEVDAAMATFERAVAAVDLMPDAAAWRCRGRVPFTSGAVPA